MITAEQLAARVHSIGSSDAAAIAGLSPWKSAYDVWCEKTRRVESFAGNAATSAGTRLERSVILWAVEELKPAFAEPDVSLVHPEHSWMTANLDCRIEFDDGEKCLVEAKTGGITSPLNYDAWGDEGTAEVPDYYAIQIQHQLAVAGTEYQRAFLAALLPPRGFVMFVLNRDEDTISALMECESRFWHEHVLTGDPPDSAPSLEVAKRLHRVPNKIAELDWELVSALERAKAAKKLADQAEEQARAALITSLGDAEQGIYEGGIVTYHASEVKGFTVAPRTQRTLLIKPRKGI